MDSKIIFEAACRGDIEALNNFLEENPLILVEYSLTSSKESLLHVVVKAQQPKFVHELINKRPELAYELNKDGLRPIDIASITGNVEIVREILSIDRELFRLEGREKRTALHYAAVNGRIGVIDELMTACAEGIKDVSDYGESALHLALKNNQVDGFCVLLKWVERVKMEYVINWGDCDGNTVLHIAASKKQLKGIKQLLSGPIRNIVGVNATNSKGLTPMDLLDIVIENPNDFHLKDILAQAGSLRAQDINIQTPPQNSLQVINKNYQTKHALKPNPSKDWFEYFKFQEGRDSPSDTRNALLVVAALIATVTFQAGVNPPSGMMETKLPRNSSYLFVFANTVGLSASILIINYLTAGFPFQRELWMATTPMLFTYGLAIGSVAEKNNVSTVLLGIASFLQFVLRFVPLLGKKAWKWWRRKHGSGGGKRMLNMSICQLITD